MGRLRYFLLGAYFGLVLTKSQVISWYKIRNMFYFREPDLYLIIGSAVLVGAVSVRLIKRFHPRTFQGEPLAIPGKQLTRGTVLGGFLFGLGPLHLGRRATRSVSLRPPTASDRVIPQIA